MNEIIIMSYAIMHSNFLRKLAEHKKKLSKDGQKLLDKLIEIEKTGEALSEDNIKGINKAYLEKVIKSDGNLLKENEIEKYLVELEKDYAKKLAERINNSSSLEEIQENIDALQNVFDRTKKVEVINLKEAGKRFFTNIDKTSDPTYYVKTKNWARINKHMKFTKGDTFIIAGRPGSGKTAFSLSLAIEFAKNGSKGIFFSLEMGEEQLINRIVSQLSQVELRKFLDSKDFAQTTQAENDRIVRAIEEMNSFADNLKLVSGSFTTNDILNIVEKEKPSFIIVDYVQLLRTNGNKERTQEVQQISMELKAIALKFKIPVIELAQLSRSVEMRADRRPILSDLKETSQLEQDASGVLMIYRDYYYTENADTKNDMEVIIRKNRNGIVGTIDYNFYGEIQKVVERN